MKQEKNLKEFRREKFEQFSCRNKWERMKGEKKENKPQTNLITIYVYNKKQLAQAQSMGEYFCSAYKKKTRS